MSFRTLSPVPITLGDGRSVGPDEPVGRIDPKNPTNARHIAAGRLIEVKPKPKPKKESE